MFALTHEVGTGGRQHMGSGRGDPPGPRPACPSAGLGGSRRTPPSLVWDYTLETAALEGAAEEKKKSPFLLCKSATVATLLLLI